MGRARRIAAGVGLAFVAASVVGMAAQAFRPGWGGGGPGASAADGVIVWFFHGRVRCTSCENIEAWTHEALRRGFPEELARGRIAWRVTDFDAPENAHFKDDFQLVASSVVLVAIRDGRRERWTDLARIWLMADDRPAVIDYVQRQVHQFLGNSPAGRVDWWDVSLWAAFWLGLQTAISPCPMATNVAAVSFIGRRVGSFVQTLAAGLSYAAGRTMAYLALALLLVGSLLSSHQVSWFVQEWMPRLLGPILVLVSLFLLDLTRLSFGGLAVSQKVQDRLATGGVGASLVLGVLFALSFCPLSASLFFGAMALSLERGSAVALPVAYGIGTAIPVVGVAVVIAFSAQRLGKAFSRVTQVEWWARRIAGVIFLAVGVFFSLRYAFGLF